MDFDAGIGQRQDGLIEPLGKGLGGWTERQEGKQVGGGAGPAGRAVEEGVYGIDQGVGWRRGIEGVPHLRRGAIQGRGGGLGPGEGGGVAGSGGGGWGRGRQSVAYGSAEGAEDLGEDGLDHAGDFVLGATGGIVEGREGDGEGAGGEVGRGRPGIGDGEEDGALEVELERFGLARFAVGDAGAAGESAEGVDSSRGELGDVVEGEDPIEAGEGEEFTGGGWKRGEGRGGGIDQGAEDAAGERLAAAGRAAEDEDGVGSAGAQGGEEPGEAAEPIGGVGSAEVEGGAEGVEGGSGRRLGGLFGIGEGLGGRGGFEGDGMAGSNGPTGGSDFDELAGGVGEVEEDFMGSGGCAAGVDAAGDADVAVLGIAGGLGVEVVEDGVEGVGGGDGFELVEGLVEEPLAEGAGADGEGAKAGGWGGDGDEGATVDAGEGDAAAGDGEEGLEAGRALGVGWGTRRDSPIRGIALGRRRNGSCRRLSY